VNNGRPKALLVRIYDYRALLNTLALLLSLCSFSMAHQVNAGISQTSEFRHFIRYFFKDELYQKAHVKFPLEVVTLTYSEELNDIVLASTFVVV
jgi:hypothetical protein